MKWKYYIKKKYRDIDGKTRKLHGSDHSYQSSTGNALIIYLTEEKLTLNTNDDILFEKLNKLPSKKSGLWCYGLKCVFFYICYI